MTEKQNISVAIYKGNTIHSQPSNSQYVMSYIMYLPTEKLMYSSICGKNIYCVMHGMWGSNNECTCGAEPSP